MTQSQFNRRTFLTIGTFGIAAGAIGLRTGLAQDSTPAAGEEVAHPAHIHTGTCEELGDVAFPLNDVAPLEAGATPSASPAASPAAGDMGEVVAESTTDVDVSLDDILASEHAINVHESKENIGNYIACGNITGTVTDGQLTIQLDELNDSGYSGQAVLVDNGDGTTTVTVTLMSSGDAAGTPASAHSGHSDAAAGVEVMIKDFAYDPDPVTIKVGESVTWTNQDTAPHTATGMDREVLQSGKLDQGQSFTQTFDTAGSYEYFCEYHPNMKGVVNVE
jgi:plastocyanin